MMRALAILVSLLIAGGGVWAASGLVAVMGPFLMHHVDSPVFHIVPIVMPILVALGMGVFVAIRSGRVNRIDPGL